MKKRFRLRRIWPGLALPMLVLAVLGWSCTSAPMPLDLPSDHPASTRGAAAPFEPPPNPFAEVVPLPPAIPTPEKMDHSGHGGHKKPSEHSGHGGQGGHGEHAGGKKP